MVASTLLKSSLAMIARAAIFPAAAVSPGHALLPPCSKRSVGSLHRQGVVAMGHGSHTSDNDPNILLREKERNLTGKTPEVVPGAPGWNPQLASDSEAAVKAERMADLSIEELQKKTVEVVEQMHKEPGEAEEHPGTPNPHQDSHSIRDNLEYSKKRMKESPPENPL